MEDYQAIADETCKNVVAYYDDTDWIEHKTTKEGRVSYKKSRDWEGQIYRCDFTVAASPQKVEMLLTDIPQHLKWNKNMKEIEKIMDISEDLQMRYTVSPSALMGLISSRDFCTLLGTSRIPDRNMTMIYFKSIEYEKCPSVDKYVRAVNYPSGSIIKPIEGEPNKSDVVNITQFDAKLRPRSLAEKVYPSVLLEYATYLQDGAKALGEE
ncbi:stAR-related lipid transfer protein 6-like [Glandiceps talaboti]